MNITELIVDTLLKGKSVEIVGIGTLKSTEEEAHHDAVTGTYYPTHKVITFSNQEIGDKSMVSLVAEKECVSQQVAQMMWNNYVDALNDKLNREGSHTFPGLGDIQKTGNYISFSPDKNAAPIVCENQPIRNVKTYEKSEEIDPFAAFEKPIVEEAPKVAEEAVVAEEPKAVEEIVPDQTEVTSTPNAEVVVEETVAEEPVAENESIAENEPVAEPASKEAVIENPQNESPIEAASPAEPSSTPSNAEEKPLCVSEIFQQFDNMPKETSVEEKPKKKRHGWIWILILLILLLVAGGGYYYYFYRPSMQTGSTEQTTAKENDQTAVNETLINTDNELLSDSTQATDTAANSAESESEESLQQSATNATPSMVEKAQRIFTLNTDLITFEADEIDGYSAIIRDNMSEYIAQFLSDHHYGQAKDAMMEKVYNYAQRRYAELCDGEGYSVTRFFPQEDPLRDYLMGELKSRKASRTRATIQTELMDNTQLETMLNEVIEELGLQPNDVGAAVVKKEVQPKAETVPTARFEKNSKQGYDLIAGFYTNKNSASRQASRLKSLGCDAYVIDKDGLYYVSMGSAATQTAAEALYKHVKSWYEGDVAIRKI